MTNSTVQINFRTIAAAAAGAVLAAGVTVGIVHATATPPTPPWLAAAVYQREVINADIKALHHPNWTVPLRCTVPTFASPQQSGPPAICLIPSPTGVGDWGTVIESGQSGHPGDTFTRTYTLKQLAEIAPTAANLWDQYWQAKTTGVTA